MTMDDHGIEVGSEANLAIQRALEAANLRTGDSMGASSFSVAQDWEPSAAETGEATAAFDGD